MRKLYLICCIITVTICVLSCGNLTENSKNNITTTTTLTLTPTTEKEKTSQINEEALSLSAIKDVVQNKITFTCNENNQQVYLKNFRSENYLLIDEKEDYEYTEDVGERKQVYTDYCWIDMDGNMTPDLLLQAESSNILLLHFENGTVYGDVFPYRGMLNVKKDGTFVVSGGTADQLVGKLSFSNGECIFKELADFDGSDEQAPIYCIDGKTVDNSVVEAYLKRQDNKESASWQTYNSKALLDYSTTN